MSRYAGQVDKSKGTCTSARVCLAKADAEYSAKRIRRRQSEGRGSNAAHAYHCDDCGWWHVGHQPAAVARDRSSKRRFRGRRRLGGVPPEPRPVSADPFPPHDAPGTAPG